MKKTSEDAAFAAALFAALGAFIVAATLYSTGVIEPATLDTFQVFVLGIITSVMAAATLLLIIEG